MQQSVVYHSRFLSSPHLFKKFNITLRPKRCSSSPTVINQPAKLSYPKQDVRTIIINSKRTYLLIAKNIVIVYQLTSVLALRVVNGVSE